MIRRSCLLLFTLCILTPGVHAENTRKVRRQPAAVGEVDGRELMSQARVAVEKKDDLELRLLARKARKANLNAKQWTEFRSFIHKRPGAGWDLLRAWDRSAPKDLAVTKTQKKFEDLVDKADTDLADKKFAAASKGYEPLLKALRTKNIEFGGENFFLYHSLLHSYARALYGEGRYKEALVVYQWISLNYPFIRKIQFEKMWAAFMAEDYSATLGAIASQNSSYFSSYLEPESYLVQFYIYKKLCREENLKKVSAEVVKFRSQIDSGKYRLEEWARSDMETLTLLRLTQGQPTGNSERQAEIALIRKSLEARYQKDLARTKEQLEKVMAYLNLAVGAKPKDLPQVIKIPQVHQLLKSQDEMWPVQDAEDWIDELGRHRYIGQSKCRPQK